MEEEQPQQQLGMEEAQVPVGEEAGGAAAAIEISGELAEEIPDLRRMDSLVLIPLDNLILFLADPGGTSCGAVQPDRR